VNLGSNINHHQLFRSLNTGWEVINASTKAFWKHPLLLLPLFTVWGIYASTIIYFKWHFNWDDYSNNHKYLIGFLITFGFAFLLSISCSILLELIQQNETGKRFNLFKSLAETFTKNLIQILVLSFIWAVIWFLLMVIEMFLSRRKSSLKDEEETAENIAKTLANSEGNFLSFSFEALKKGIRMIVFLIMPAFAWENYGIGKSIRRGLAILKQRSTQFISAYTLSYLAAAIVFLPPAIMYKLSSKNIIFPESAWILCIFYLAFAWSYTIYLEQMMTAELYLRHLKWERAVLEAKSQGKKLPRFYQIRAASLLDKQADLIS
jgi:hypothetical protein